MDTRNITVETPKVNDGKYLEAIFELQESLLSHYIEIEGLAKYPINVNSRESQILLKDFTARIIEELAEGYESQLLIEDISSKNTYFKGVSKTGSYNAVVNHIQNLNEELADALHFMVELLIYTNIGPKEINDYIESVAGDMYDNLPILERSLKVGRQLVYTDNTIVRGINYNLLDSFDDKMINNNLSKESILKIAPVGWYTDKRYLYNVSHLCWDISYSLSISRNFLKNKPWKQTQELTDESAYQKAVAESFIKLMGYYFYLGFTPESLFEIYFKKNQVNLFRIKSKY